MKQMSFRLKTFRPEWRNLLIIITFLALTGCKYSFDLDYQNAQPMVAIRSYICADSLVTIDINKLVPLAELETTDSTLINPHYSLKCNGVEVDCDELRPGISKLSLRTHAFKSGEKIEIVFESDDTEKAIASTVIPGTFPQYKLELCKSSNAQRNIKIRYNDDPDTEDWYAASVKWNGLQERYVGLDEPQIKEVRNQMIYPPTGYNDLQLEPESYSPIIVSFQGDYLYVWKDSEEEDNEYDLCFNYRSNWDGYVTSVKDAEVQCTLFKLSEEMYRYLFAEFDSWNNPFIEAGMSSPAFTYSNVRNGAGYLCGYSVVHSEWIKDNLFEE